MRQELESRIVATGTLRPFSPLSGNPPPGSTKLLKLIDDISSSLELNYCQPKCFHELSTNNWYKHVTAFLYTLITQTLHHGNVFCSNRVVLSLQYMANVLGSKASVSDSGLSKEMADV